MVDNSGMRLRTIHMKDTAANRQLVLSDGLSNVITGMNGGTDPQSYAFYSPSLFLNQSQVDNAYRTSPFFKKVVVGPATDAVRAWRSFQAKDAEITAIEAEEKRLGLRDKVREAEIAARLYGGSAILIGTNDADTSLPLEPATVKKGGLRYLNVVSRYEITIPNLILDPGSPYYLQPDMYLVNGGTGQQVSFHPSRVCRFNFGDLPSNMLRENQGWGSPLLEVLWNTLVNLDTAQGSIAALLSKLKIDTVYVPGLTSMAATAEGEERLKKRFLVAKMFESLLSVKLLDAAASSDGVGEKWEQFTLSVAGYPDLLMAFAQALAGAADYPLTRLYGTQASGLQNTGAADEQNYDRMVSAGQELNLRPRLDMIDAVLVPSAIGAMPASYGFSFNALSVDSAETKAKVSKLNAETIKIYSESGTVAEEVLQEGAKNRIIEDGIMPGAEAAFDEYATGNLEPLIEGVEEAAVDPLIPVDPVTGLPTQNRESRLFGQRQAAANDHAARLMNDGMPALDAFKEATRLTDAEPRPLYVSRHLKNGNDVRAHFEKQGLRVTVPNEKLHTTLIYSKTPIDWFSVSPDDWGRDGELVVKEGGARMMAKFGPNENAIVLMFSSSQFSWRHEEFIRAGASYDFDYQPHLTLNYEGQDIDLAKIQPYKGELRFGYEDFQEIIEDWSSK